MANILIVDDEPVILTTLETLLKSEGHVVSSALNGPAANELLESSTFDLMISDVRMKPINGIEMLDFSKKTYPDMPVIMLTAHKSEQTADRAIGMGAAAYMTKPFNVIELLKLVNETLAANS